MTAPTPGQAAHVAYMGESLAEEFWNGMDPTSRGHWEDAAQAAIGWWHADRDLEPPREVSGEQQPELAMRPSPALTALLADRNQLREALRRIALGNAGDPSVAADKALTASREYREQWDGIEAARAAARHPGPSGDSR